MLLHFVLLIIGVTPMQAYQERIDCGSQIAYYDKDGSFWMTDVGFVKETGNDKSVSTQSFSKWPQLNTLRVFIKDKKICYNLPAQPSQRYMIRAAFYYGNYDGLSSPPTFDMEFDENNWTRVVTSNTDPQNYELIYTSGGDHVKVCLIRTSDKQFPFINVLELWTLDDDMYDGMTRDMAWLSSYRYAYGAAANTTDDWILGYPVDSENRLWEPMDPSGLTPVKSTATYFYGSCPNSPPDVVVLEMVEALNSTNTVSLPFYFSDGTDNLLHYVTVYFTEVRSLEENETRSFGIYVNDKYVRTVTTQYEHCTSAWAFVQSNGTVLDVQLRADANSTLPPVISAIEVYTGREVHYKKLPKWVAPAASGGGGFGLILILICCCCCCLARDKCGKSRQGVVQRPGGVVQVVEVVEIHGVNHHN